MPTGHDPLPPSGQNLPAELLHKSALRRSVKPGNGQDEAKICEDAAVHHVGNTVSGPAAMRKPLISGEIAV
jgi:hypothetical protein